MPEAKWVAVNEVGNDNFATSIYGGALMDEDEDDPIVHVCAGPPLCGLEGDDAVAAQLVGCALCRRIIIHPDGSETVITRTIQ